jgi:chromosome segregation ATPase
MLTENGMIDERYEVAAELMTLRAEIERLERLANTWAEVIMKRDTEIERLARDNERLLLKANSLSDDLRETEAELAEAKSGLSAARDLKLDEIDRLQRELAEAHRALNDAVIDNEQYKQANDELTKEILLLRHWSSHFRAT